MSSQQAGIFEPLLAYAIAELGNQTEAAGTNATTGTSSSAKGQQSLLDTLQAWAMGEPLQQVVNPMAGSLAGLILLLLLAATAAAATAKCAPGRRRCRRRRRPLRLTLAAVAAVCLAASAVPFWHRSACLLRGLSPPDGNGSGTSGGSATSVQGTLDRVTADTEALLVDTLRHTNATLIDIFTNALPQLQRLLRDLAGGLFDNLALDTRLSPLFISLDAFVATVRLIVDAMTAVAAARGGGGALELMVELRAITNDIRSEAVEAVESVCAGAGAQCGDLASELDRLRTLPDTARIDTDVSVTAVTLLDRLLPMNITQLEAKVTEAKSVLGSAIGSLDGQVADLLGQLVGTVSREFQRGLREIVDLSANMRAAVGSPGVRTGLGSALTTAAAIVAAFCIAYVVTAVRLAVFAVLEVRRASAERSEGVDAGVGSCRCCCFRALNAACCVVALLLLGCFFLVGGATSAAGRAAQREACAPLVTAEGRRGLDAGLDEFLRTSGWPKLHQMLLTLTNVTLPFRLSPDPPTGVLGSLLTRCGHPANETLAQILGLLDAVDAAKFVDSDLVTGQLTDILVKVKSNLLGRSADSLIPPYIATDLLPSLRQFAGILDPSDYSASLDELAKPLFHLDDVRLVELSQRLRDLSSRVLAGNPTDARGFQLAQAARRLDALLAVRRPAVATGLANLHARFSTLQGNRLLGNMTTQLVVRLEEFRRGFTALTGADVDRRFDQSVTKARPQAVALLEGLLRLALMSIARCDGLLPLFAAAGDLCGGCITCLTDWGLCLQVAAAFASACFLLVSRCCCACCCNCCRTSGCCSDDEAANSSDATTCNLSSIVDDKAPADASVEHPQYMYTTPVVSKQTEV